MDKAKLGLIGIIGEAMKQDYWAAMQRVAEIGYQGVEATGPLLQGDPAANAARLRGLGLEPLTVTASRERLRDEPEAVLAEAESLGVRRVSCWWGPAESRDQVLADAEIYDRAGRRFAEAGVKLAYHHHDHELLTAFDGVSALDLIAVHTDPAAVYFVVDLAWAAIGQQDPAVLIRRLGPRVASLHVKDATAARRGEDRKVPWTVVGTGVVPIAPAVRAALDLGVEWAVVEQDQLRHLGPWDTVTASRLNLLELGLI